MSNAPAPASDRVAHPGFWEAFRFWLKLGFISFGGPAGQIALMQYELVEKKKWISQSRFLHALNYCMLLPGPEAQQLAIYVGWLLHRTAGGVAAGSLFVIPSIFVLWLLSLIYTTCGNLPWIAAIFYGLKPAVIAIVAVAIIRIGRKALKNEVMWGIALLAFTALYFFKLPFPLIIAGAGVTGWIGGRLRPEKFRITTGHPLVAEDSVLGCAHEPPLHTLPSWPRAIRATLTGLTLWCAPTLLAGLLLGPHHAVFQQGLFFSKAAVVTFGGAYAVLPYVAQQAVEHYQWLQPGQMLDGLGLAETTPGPLIMVLQFVGFVGAWNHPGNLSPLLAATLGAFITTWATFTPCFLWIFLGGPYIEQLRGNTTLNSALSTITAAVVGVILNLAVWFALHVWSPAPGAVDYFAIALSLAAILGMQKWKWNIIPVVIGSGLLGLLYKLLLQV